MKCKVWKFLLHNRPLPEAVREVSGDHVLVATYYGYGVLEGVVFVRDLLNIFIQFVLTKDKSLVFEFRLKF